MNKQLKRLLLSSALLISSQVMASTPVFQVIASLSNITMGPSASATLDFTATNNTAVALKVSNLQAFGNLTNVQSSVTADTCTGSTIASNGSCTSTVTITAPNILEASHGYVDLKVCIDNGAQCSASRIKPAITLDPSEPTNPQPVSGCTGTDGACKVFVSTSTMKGDMKVIATGDIATACNETQSTGLARGNCICTNEATVNGYDGEWHAWLSDPDTDALDNINYTAEHSYIRTDDDDTLVAGPTQLLSGPLKNPITLIESFTWTGTKSTGLKEDHNCNRWSSSSVDEDMTQKGITSRDNSWTASGEQECTTPSHIYCFQG